MKVRQFFYKNGGDSNIKRHSYYANVAPRHYQLRSTTQGILIIIAFINAIAYTAIANGGIEKLFSHYSDHPLLNLGLNLIPLLGLTFIQYMAIFKYLMRKDIVKVNLEFNPKQHINEIKLCYYVPRSITNNSFTHVISRILYWLIDLPGKENIIFLRRGKTHCRKISIENNQKYLELIAGYYQITAQGHDGINFQFYKPKDLLIFSNIYREYQNGEIIELEKGSKKEFEEFRVKRMENFLNNWSKEQRITFYMETKYLVYTLICYLFTFKKDLYSPFIFSIVAIFIIAPKFFIDFLDKSYLCDKFIKPKIKRKVRRIKAYIRLRKRKSKRLIKKIKES